ncbi:MAG: NAD(+)/NADH kinase [Armatimonadetes bacterium]|nr:NAD(+)/NADH kinase [Armatimonadota bacterium]
MRIHLLVNARRPDAVEAAKKTASWLRGKGADVASDAISAPLVGVPPFADLDMGNCDLVVTFGGDGTLIRAANHVSEQGTPILGVYYGRFGFVTQCSGGEVGAALSEFFDGKSVIEHRMMLQTDIIRGNSTLAVIHSLNEMVLQRAVATSMLTFDVFVGARKISTYPADGLIVCTPTGSTAYNLSAGGPILDPHVQGITITALAPHTLNSRPFILSPEAVLRVKVHTNGETVLSADGHYRLHLLNEDEVLVRRSPRTTRLIVVDSEDFLRKLGERLFWSRRHSGDEA